MDPVHPPLQDSPKSSFHPRHVDLTLACRKALAAVLDRAKHRKIKSPQAFQAFQQVLRMEFRDKNFAQFCLDNVPEIARRIASQRPIRLWKNWNGQIEFDG